jgi:hypothetical protein
MVASVGPSGLNGAPDMVITWPDLPLTHALHTGSVPVLCVPRTQVDNQPRLVSGGSEGQINLFDGDNYLIVAEHRGGEDTEIVKLDSYLEPSQGRQRIVSGDSGGNVKVLQDDRPA